MSEADGTGTERPGHTPGSEDAGLSERLRDLDRRLGEKRPERDLDTASEAAPRPGFAMALRLSADFVAGVVVGAALGWGVDQLFGISPWGMIVFLLLGFAAGVLNVLRTAGLVAEPPTLNEAENPPPDENDDPASRRLD